MAVPQDVGRWVFEFGSPGASRAPGMWGSRLAVNGRRLGRGPMGQNWPGAGIQAGASTSPRPAVAETGCVGGARIPDVQVMSPTRYCLSYPAKMAHELCRM